jgi:hypothetical protein
MESIKLTRAIASVLLASSPALVLAENVSLYDYKQATSAYEDAYVDGRFNLNSGNQEQTSYNLDVSVDYERVFTSADTNLKADFNGAGSRSRSSSRADDDVSTYQAIGALTYDNYLESGSNGLFWYGKGELGLQKGMDDPFTKVTAGMGYGRVVNVTPMAKAMRLVEALIERGILKAAPASAVYQAVADVIAKESEYRSKHGLADYEQMWIQDIETALGETLGARGAIKVYDVLSNERISTRKHGWLVRAGVGAVITDYDGENGKPALEVGAEYHRPLDSKTQFSNEAIATAILNDDNDSFLFNNTMGLTYEISDRVDWENAWLLSYDYNESSNDIIGNTLSSTYRYYLSNALSFNVTAKLAKVDDDIDGNNNDDVDKSLLVGLTYRLK